MEPPDKDDDEEPFVSTGPTLDAQGNLQSPTGASAAVGPHRSSVLRAPPERRAPEVELELEQRPKAQALELEERAPPAETDYVPPPEPSKARIPSGGPSGWPLLVLLLLSAAGACYYFFGQQPKGPPPRPRIAVTITITSEPNGAAVSIEGTPVGVTPWAVDNTWASGPVNVSVTMPGYRAWSGTFPGGRPARVEARLQRR